MWRLLKRILTPLNHDREQSVLAFMRFGIGIMMLFHGMPKILGGISKWKELGAFVHPLGIYYLPIMWGFLGALTESFGSIAFAVGFGTRIASFCLSVMMFVATVWHLDRGDSYNVYSFPLTLIIIFVSFMLLGGGKKSVDYYLIQKKKNDFLQ